MATQTLNGLLEESAAKHGDRIAAIEPAESEITYRELDALSDRVAAHLRARGVRPGDRVGLHLRKSIATLGSIFGVLKAGAAYVPVDFSAPARRNAYIFKDCGVRCIISQRPGDFPAAAEGVNAESLETVDPRLSKRYLLAESTTDGGPAPSEPQGLAYILYTSGSTGMPKGVMLTHENALAFVNWCSDTFEPVPSDRFSSHAPFHFDLSILDIYVPLRHGAAVVLIGEEAGRQPKQLASLIADERISVWYSTPSILKLLLEVRDLGDRDYSALRLVLFAGEVFPLKHLRSVQSLWPDARYFNLYGPTETNVCTYFEVPVPLPADRNEPVPIGAVCSGDSAMVTDENYEPMPPGGKGELCISGPSVTPGYWNLPDRNRQAFFTANGKTWYKTGDIVRENSEGCYSYVGRRDRMVKRRGYRVELGEIEAALYRHEHITEAAVIASSSEEGVTIIAFINWTGAGKPSLIRLKKFCMDNLPAYMIPDRFSIQSSLPKTSTDKIHYQALKEIT